MQTISITFNICENCAVSKDCQNIADWGNPFEVSAKFHVGVNFSVSKSKYSGPILAHWGQTLEDLEWGKPQKFGVWALKEFFCWLQQILDHVLSAIRNH